MLPLSFNLKIFSRTSWVLKNFNKKKDFDFLNFNKKIGFSNIAKLSRKQTLQTFGLFNKNIKNNFSEKDLTSLLSIKSLGLPKPINTILKKSANSLSKKNSYVGYYEVFAQYKRRLFVFSKISFYNSYFKFFYRKLCLLYRNNKLGSFDLKKSFLDKSVSSIKFITYNKDFFYNKYVLTSYKSKRIFSETGLLYDINKQRMFPFKFFLNPVKPNIYSNKSLLVNTLVINRLVGIFVKKGNRILSEKTLFDIAFSFKKNFYGSSHKLSFFFRYLILILSLYAPKLTLRNRRKGSVVYKVPFFITPYQQHSIFLKWLKDSTFKRAESTHKVRFRKEILELFDQSVSSSTLKKHIELHNSIIKNRAFAHFRWI